MKGPSARRTIWMVLSRMPVLENTFDKNTSGRPPENRPTPPDTRRFSSGSHLNETRGIRTSRPS